LARLARKASGGLHKSKKSFRRREKAGRMEKKKGLTATKRMGQLEVLAEKKLRTRQTAFSKGDNKEGKERALGRKEKAHGSLLRYLTA